jgi:hypothetical protein
MRFEAFNFGSICIDGKTYDYDVVIDRAAYASARKSDPESSVTNSGTRRCR